jgi:hypothetical protein
MRIWKLRQIDTRFDSLTSSLQGWWRACAAGVLLLALASLATAQTPGVGAADPARYLDGVKALTTPAMEGRGPGTQGLTRAARLLEEEYKRLGLEPAGTRGFLQAFQLTTGARLAGRNALVEQLGGARKQLKLNEDFVPFSFSSSGQANGPVVFAGYGATAPEFGYDDYAGIDVTGKTVLVLRYEPAAFSAHSQNPAMTPHASLVAKAINARNHGAKAIVVVNGMSPGRSGGAAPSPLTGDPDPLLRFGSVSGPIDARIIFVQAKNHVAQQWLASAGKSLADVQKQIDNTMHPSSFALPETLRVSLQTGVEQTRATVNNVLAYLPGKSDEYIIIGAHYDHLGYGGPESLAPSQTGHFHPCADE